MGGRKTKTICNYCEQLLRKDDTIFRRISEYIDNTTTHGVVRIFSGKSIIKRLFWLLVVLVASAGCLYNCIDRIRFLASAPTSTASPRECNLLTFLQ